MVAAENGHLEVVQYLKEQGANIEAKNKGGDTPFILSAAKGHLEVVKYLYEQGANIEMASSRGITPLWCAAYYDHLEVVKYLKEQGANIEAVDNEGRTSLMCAAQYGHQEVVDYLKKQVSNIQWVDVLDQDNYILLRERLNANQIRINEIIIEKGGVRRSLLHWACCEGKPKLVAELLYGRAEQRVGNPGDLAGVEREAVRSDLVVDIETPDANGFSPLHYAAGEGHLEIVRMLVEYKEIIEGNSVEPGQTLRYTDYVDSIVRYVNQSTRLSRQTALQLAKAHKRHGVKAYLKGIQKGGSYCCLAFTSRSPIAKANISILGSGGGITTNREADVIPKGWRFNKHSVWIGVRPDVLGAKAERSS